MTNGASAGCRSRHLGPPFGLGHSSFGIDSDFWFRASGFRLGLRVSDFRPLIPALAAGRVVEVGVLALAGRVVHEVGDDPSRSAATWALGDDGFSAVAAG